MKFPQRCECGGKMRALDCREYGLAVVRRRECKACGRRAVTYELVAPDRHEAVIVRRFKQSVTVQPVRDVVVLQATADAKPLHAPRRGRK